MDPVSLLSCRYNVESFVNFETTDGMVLERTLLCNCKSTKDVLSADSWNGIDPVNLLFCRNNEVSPVSSLIDDDIVPCKLILLRSNSDTALPAHVTPVHVETSVRVKVTLPQACSVAVLPSQFHPSGEGVEFDGQLVIPSLKAQSALESDCGVATMVLIDR